MGRNAWFLIAQGNETRDFWVQEHARRNAHWKPRFAYWAIRKPCLLNDMLNLAKALFLQIGSVDLSQFSAKLPKMEGNESPRSLRPSKFVSFQWVAAYDSSSSSKVVAKRNGQIWCSALICGWWLRILLDTQRCERNTVEKFGGK